MIEQIQPASTRSVSGNFIDQQMTPWVWRVLLTLLVANAIWMPLPFIASHQPINWWIGLSGSSIAFVGTSLALLLLRRGSFYVALLTSAVGLLVGSAVALFGWGLSDGAGVLCIIALPIILTALLSTPRGLLVVTGLCMLVVAITGILERPPYEMTGFASLGVNHTIITVGSFILANGVLAVFVQRFSQSLRDSLTIALMRQHELEEYRAHLEEQVKERKHARERIVAAREEERRRLRRDLHDGLGPVLATLVVQVEAARELLATEPAEADMLLADVMNQTQAAISDIRRLVYALRPPALDDLGLVGALRAHAAAYHHAGVQMEIVAPEHMPPLPAAVEVAAFRIVQEALTNVIRHSQARQCEASLSILGIDEHQALAVEIWDDGVGLSPAHAAGVGLVAMRERAAEVGGTCHVEGASCGGTRVSVFLPLAPPDEMEGYGNDSHSDRR